MAQEIRNCSGLPDSSEVTLPSPERLFDRRRFLGGAALAGLTVPILGAASPVLAQETKGGDSRENYLNVYNFGARGDGKTDDTAAIQKALDAAGKQGGNVVLLPRGAYLCGGSLHVPGNVTLQGIWRAPNRGSNGHDMGTLLLTTGGKGNQDAPPFITLGANGTLYGLTIFHPEQTCPSPPVEYPWTVRQLADNASLVNVTIVNPWLGVDFGTIFGGRHYIRGLYGQPLRIGLFIDNCEDVGRVEDVHFWPFWKDADHALSTFTATHGTSFLIGRTDWEYMVNCFTIGHQVGYHFVHTPRGNPNAVLVNCGSDQSIAGTASTSVLVDGVQPHSGISFVNGQFQGAPTVVVNGGGNTVGPVKFTNCGFWGQQQTTDTFAILQGSGHVTFTACHFKSWAQINKKAPAILLRSGGVTVNGCEFMDINPYQINIEKGATCAAILGNRMHGPIWITNKIGSKAQIGLNATG